MRHLSIVFLLAVIILSLVPIESLASSNPSITGRPISLTGLSYTRAFVSPILLDDSYWVYGAYVEDEGLLSVNADVFFDNGVFKIVRGAEEPLGRVLILLGREAPIETLRGKTRGLLGVFPTHVGYLVYAVIARSDLETLSRTPGVLAIMPDIRFDALINRQIRGLEAFSAELQHAIQQGSPDAGGSGAYHYTVEITGAQRVWEELGVRGEEVKIAIIDTGVDYGSPALGLDSIARDERGTPLIFDSSSLGLVLTPVSVTVSGGVVTVDFSQLYVFMPPYYIVSWTAPYLYVGLRGCASLDAFVPAPTAWSVDGIPIAAGRFGLFFQLISAIVGGTSSTLMYSIPVLVVDSDGDGLFDSLYVDTTTGLYLLSIALGRCGVSIPGAPSEPDFSFADEVRIAYGNEVIARDLNGDSVTDYSVGTLAGFVYDTAFAIILEKAGVLREIVPTLPFGHGVRILGPWEIWFYEPVALIWPGLDARGDYVVIAYDYHSHGTFCATTAAGRDYYAETGYGVRSIAGQAPAAKIAAAPALYMGTVLASIYFFTGFDIETPYGIGSRYLWPILSTNPWIAFEGYTWRWSYTGKPLVDVTSNSYGISAWAIWGWASGMDPASVVFDYTTLVSSVAHFIAVGNGGPGWGTIASPGASALSIGVGAATEFTYRPIFGYAWPGSSRQVITWSNRGPTELGIVKPDIVAVGSFAWAVGRTWEALRARTLDGTRVHDLFSGTSQATPMAAGAGALVISAYRSATGERMPAYMLKTLLMNTARDMGFDELSQGAGFVNAYGAVKAALDPRYPRVYSTSILADVMRELGVSAHAFTYGGSVSPNAVWFEPKIFIPEVEPRRLAVRTLTIEGRGSFTITPVRMAERGSFGLCDIVLFNLNPAIITRCAKEDLTLRVAAATAIGHLIIDLEKLRGFDYFEIQLIYPYEFFERGGRTGSFSQLITTSIVELAYWIDVGADGRFSWLETARIMYDIRGANVLRIQIGDLEGQLREIEELAFRYMGVDVSNLPKYLVVRIGVSGATYRGDLPIKARVVGYAYERWDDVRVAPARIAVAARASVAVIARGPETPGFYSGYLLFEDPRQGFRALVPVSFFTPIVVREPGRVIEITSAPETTLYKNYALRGAFDYTWRYESGDWRVFKVKIDRGVANAWALLAGARWPVLGSAAFASNVDIHVYGPYTYYMVDDETLEVIPITVNGAQLAAELTIDPSLRATPNPRAFWDSVGPGYSAVMSPVASGETYRVVVRNIQFSGRAYEERITLTLSLLTARARTVPVAQNVFQTVIEVRGVPALLPVSATWSGEAIVKPTGSATLFYDSGYYVHSTVVDYRVSGGTAIAVVLTTVSGQAPPGTYIVPVLFTLPAPFTVTTVGHISAGTPNVVFMYSHIPYYIIIES